MTLHHLFYFNGTKYADLKDKRHKEIIDEMVVALNKKKYGDLLLMYIDTGYVNLIYPGHQTTFEFDFAIPEDLMGKVSIVFVGIVHPSADSLFATDNY